MSTLAITPDMLKELIATAIAAAIEESRKPLPPTEKELAEIQLAQQHRAANADGVIQGIKNKRFIQQACSHEHSKQAGGGTHCVWVKEEDPRSPGFIYCQKCEARVRPGTYDFEGLPYQRDRGAIFDGALFNRLFQDCGEQAGVIMG